MAPEQLLRQPLDARSDLYALCVVLYEGIYGERPFRGKNWQELAVATLAGQFTPPAARPADPRLARPHDRPRPVATDPGDRHPTIDALLAELRRPQLLARRRRQWTLALAGLGLGLAVGATALAGPAPCSDTDAETAALWTPERQAALHAALVAVSPPIVGAEVSAAPGRPRRARVQDLRDMSR
jgi:hypothetical protein